MFSATDSDKIKQWTPEEILKNVNDLINKCWRLLPDAILPDTIYMSKRNANYLIRNLCKSKKKRHRKKWMKNHNMREVSVCFHTTDFEIKEFYADNNNKTAGRV
jgi:hypothetical protein